MGHHNLTFGHIPTTCFRTERPAFFHSGSRPKDVDQPLEKFIRMLKKTVYNDKFTIMADGVPVMIHPKWIRDHIHEMKAFKHWEHDLKDYIDFMIRRQHPDGFFYEMVQIEGESHTRPEMADGDFVLHDEENSLALTRLELEADIEYLMVEGAYTVLKSTGDMAWIEEVLPALEKGIDYMTSHPKRWDAERGLVKRPFTCDTWDFVHEPVAGKSSRNIHEETPMSIMHGDNLGIYAAMLQLAEMNGMLGREEKKEEWVRRAGMLRENLNRHCWNGRFYIHQLHLGHDGLDDQEENRLSLSLAYDINRGITTPDQAKSILDSFRSRLKETDYFAEWFTIHPPYEKFFLYRAGSYINGAVASLTAGELAKAAFANGEEKYGWDILCRLMEISERDGELFFMYNPVTGENAGGGPSGWGASALLCAIEEGLAGVADGGVCFDRLCYSPRWAVTPIREVKYITGYEQSHTFVETEYTRGDDGIGIVLKTPSERICCHVLLPDDVKTAAGVEVDGKAVEVCCTKVGESVYADFEVQGYGRSTGFDAYPKLRPISIQIRY